MADGPIKKLTVPYILDIPVEISKEWLNRPEVSQPPEVSSLPVTTSTATPPSTTPKFELPVHPGLTPRPELENNNHEPFQDDIDEFYLQQVFDEYNELYGNSDYEDNIYPTNSQDDWTPVINV